MKRLFEIFSFVYMLQRFFENWIYPGYYLKNLLFYRYDRIKVPQIKSYEYADKEYLMLCANMQIIVDFIEKENPEKHICWYKDELGADLGHKYGENPNFTILFPEYKDEYIMDIIKDIYNYWKVIYLKQTESIDYLYKYLSENLIGEIQFQPIDDQNGQILFDKKNTIKTKQELYQLNLNWNILDYCFESRNDLLDQNKVRRKVIEMEFERTRDCQKYLHLAIQVRPYLWT